MSRKAAALILFSLIFLVGQAGAQVPGCGYVAATWNDDSVHLLTNSMTNASSFPVGASDPNGIATDGSTIWTGHFSSQSVRAFTTSGTFLYSWTDGALSGLQGMEYMGSNRLAVYASGQIRFFNAQTGASMGSFAAADGSSIEGITFDGTYLYQLGDVIYVTNPVTGAVITTIPNAASGCAVGGSGIAVSGANELTLACESGDWYKVNKTTGAVLTSGNNGLEMFGLKSLCATFEEPVPVPALSPAALAALAALLGLVALVVMRRI